MQWPIPHRGLTQSGVKARLLYPALSDKPSLLPHAQNPLRTVSNLTLTISAESPDPVLPTCAPTLNTPSPTLQFVKVPSSVTPSILFELLLTEWHLPAPNLVVSLVSEERPFAMKSWLRDILRKGLVKAAQSTGKALPGLSLSGLLPCLPLGVGGGHSSVTFPLLSHLWWCLGRPWEQVIGMWCR